MTAELMDRLKVTDADDAIGGVARLRRRVGTLTTDDRVPVIATRARASLVL
jgi:hypothetical protein